MKMKNLNFLIAQLLQLLYGWHFADFFLGSVSPRVHCSFFSSLFILANSPIIVVLAASSSLSFHRCRFFGAILCEKSPDVFHPFNLRFTHIGEKERSGCSIFRGRDQSQRESEFNLIR